MCFSATASFVMGAALLPPGAWCLRRAARVDREALPIAAIPVAFGAQQIVEGFVWLGLDRQDAGLTRVAALAFLFFALVFWPAWIPWCGASLEEDPRSRRAFRVAALVGLLGALSAWLPLIAHARDWLDVGVMHQSIRYRFLLVPLLRDLPLLFWQIGYVALATTPLLVAGRGRFRPFGLMLLASAAVAQAVYWYAFISVWCAFAAVLSVSLAWRLAVRAGSPVRAPQLAGPARTGIIFIVAALGGTAAQAQVEPPPATAPAPAPTAPHASAWHPALGRFHIWLKGGQTDMAAGAGEWGIDRIGYLALEGFGHVGNEGYYGFEFGRFERGDAIDDDGDLLQDIDSYWLEFNAKQAFPLPHGLSFDAGLGVALFYIDGEEVLFAGGTSPLADIGFGVQGFGDFNWRSRHLLMGVGLKYQWAWDVVDINYSNLRLDAHLGMAF